jgi:hypothetical protein
MGGAYAAVWAADVRTGDASAGNSPGGRGRPPGQPYSHSMVLGGLGLMS